MFDLQFKPTASAVQSKSKPPATDTSMLARNVARGMTVVEMPGGIVRFVNVAARLLKHNLEDKRAPKTEEHLPVVCVRSRDQPECVLVFDEIEILGPSSISYTPTDPLPNTNGRGIAYMETSAPLRGYLRAGQKSPQMEHWLPTTP